MKYINTLDKKIILCGIEIPVSGLKAEVKNRRTEYSNVPGTNIPIHLEYTGGVIVPDKEDGTIIITTKDICAASKYLDRSDLYFLNIVEEKKYIIIANGLNII